MHSLLIKDHIIFRIKRYFLANKVLFVDCTKQHRKQYVTKINSRKKPGWYKNILHVLSAIAEKYYTAAKHHWVIVILLSWIHETMKKYRDEGGKFNLFVDH